MKKIFMWLLCAFVFSNSLHAQIRSAKLQASGLTCAMCARSIYKNLTALPFIDSVDTDLNASTFLIQFKKNVPVDFDAIGKKVQDAGFFVANLSLNIDSKEISIPKDKHIIVDDYVFHFLNANGQMLKGNMTLQLVDPLFVSVKDFKKFSKLSVLECVKSGVVSDCCKMPSNRSSNRVYHVII